MKITFFTFGLLFLSFTNVVAQTNTEESVGFEKGDVFLSGSIGFNSQKSGDFKNSSFGISPNIGLFVSDEVAIGGALGIVSRKINEPFFEDEEKQNGLTAGIFARYYFTPQSKFSFLGGIGANYITIKTTQGEEETKLNGFTVSVSPGINYFISESVSLGASIGLLNYSNLKDDNENSDNVSSFGLSIDLTDISLGVLIVI